MSQGAPITADNPAQPGRVDHPYRDRTRLAGPHRRFAPLLQTGMAVAGRGTRDLSRPIRHNDQSVSSLAGGKTADVLSATLLPGTVGTYQVVLHLNGDIPTDRGDADHDRAEHVS